MINLSKWRKPKMLRGTRAPSHAAATRGVR